MPRVSGGRVDGGVRVPGIYRELLEAERGRCERDDRRGERMLAELGFRYRRPRSLLDALEAGEAVIVARRAAEFAHEWRYRFPWDRSVKSVRVSPDDVVRQSEEPHPWYGRAAG